MWLWRDGTLTLLLKAVFGAHPEHLLQPDQIELPDGQTIDPEFLAIAGGDDTVGSGNGDGRPSGRSDNDLVAAMVSEENTAAILRLNERIYADSLEQP